MSEQANSSFEPAAGMRWYVVHAYSGQEKSIPAQEVYKRLGLA